MIVAFIQLLNMIQSKMEKGIARDTMGHHYMSAFTLDYSEHNLLTYIAIRFAYNKSLVAIESEPVV